MGQLSMFGAANQKSTTKPVDVLPNLEEFPMPSF